MSDNENDENGASLSELSEQLAKAVAVLEQSNRHAHKRHRLAKKEFNLREKELEQSVLSREQAERQYLIEKSRLQPTFRLTVTEFLTCEPDFMNDPEQASEAKFLADRGVGADRRALRVKVHVKGDVHYMRPSIVIKQLGGKDNDLIYAMSELIYFADVANLELSNESQSAYAYLVYRDKTTLPVVHKYQLSQQKDSALLRWDAKHLDTVYATSRKIASSLGTSKGCAALFSDSY